MTANKLKLALLGEGGVGKTTLAKTFKEGKFCESSMTIAVEFHVKRTTIDGQPVVLQIWDLGGQEQFKNMGLFPTYLKGTNGVAACFDVTDLETLDVLPSWIDMLPPTTPMVLVGLKADLLDGPFDMEEVRPLMESYPFLDFYLASAKDATMVNHAFGKLAGFALEALRKRLNLRQNNEGVMGPKIPVQMSSSHH
ncbi:MAG: Rab family GTPase [Candidatus Hodarchaeales archaeon]|jgi:small GTP-binding protein